MQSENVQVKETNFPQDSQSGEAQRKTINYILVGYGFNKEDGPYFIIDNVNQYKTDRICIPILDRVVNLMPILDKKLCVGIYDILTQESYPCPYKAFISPSNKFIHCYKCYKEIDFDPAFFRKRSRDISEKQKQYNEMEHYVYLAHFGKSNIKVGTAYHNRLIDRLTEQGARAALIIRKCKNAYDACKLEQDICKGSGITDRMYVSKKIALLGAKFDFASSKRALLACNAKISYDEGKNYSDDVLNLNKYYFLGKEPKIPGGFTEITTLAAEIKCKIKALIGKALILEYFGNHKVISMDKLVGKVKILKLS